MSSRPVTPPTAESDAAAISPRRLFIRQFAESKIALTAFVVLVLIVIIALIAPFVAPQDPYDLAQVDILDGGLAPGTQQQAQHLFLLLDHRR